MWRIPLASRASIWACGSGLISSAKALIVGILGLPICLIYHDYPHPGCVAGQVAPAPRRMTPRAGFPAG